MVRLRFFVGSRVKSRETNDQDKKTNEKTKDKGNNIKKQKSKDQ